jgi:hypothetical protein
MHGFQPVQQLHDDLQDRAAIGTAPPPHPSEERFPLFVLHDHIGRVVGLEKAADTHDVRVPERGQRARLGQKLRQPGPEGAAPRAGLGMHGLIAGPRHEAGREKLLDRDLAIQVEILGQVGDAESPAAQHRQDAVLVQGRAGRECADRCPTGRPGGGGLVRREAKRARRLRPVHVPGLGMSFPLVRPRRCMRSHLLSTVATASQVISRLTMQEAWPIWCEARIDRLLNSHGLLRGWSVTDARDGRHRLRNERLF